MVYSGRYVTVGLSRQQLQQLTSSRKGWKTEHLVGLVQVSLTSHDLLLLPDTPPGLGNVQN